MTRFGPLWRLTQSILAPLAQPFHRLFSAVAESTFASVLLQFPLLPLVAVVAPRGAVFDLAPFAFLGKNVLTAATVWYSVRASA